MKIPCPRCGRGTIIEEEIGDFPTRCIRCGALVRRRTRGPDTDADDAREESPAAGGTQVAQIDRGALAGLLTRRPAPRVEAREPKVPRAGTAVLEPADEAQPQGVLRPETRRELLRVRARQQAIRKAHLKSSQQALGTLTWTGLVLAALLALGALALKAQAMWRHPTPPRADVLRMGP